MITYETIINQMTKNCVLCGKEYKKPYYSSRNNWHKRLYCSKKCSNKINPIGMTVWNKGKIIPQLSGSKNGFWKGEKVGYSGIHKWVAKNFKKINSCVECKQKQLKTCWANISGQYLRDRNDWMELCYKCHYHLDRNRVYENKYSTTCLRKYRKHEKKYNRKQKNLTTK